MAFLNAGLYQDPILDDRGNALPQASVQVNLVGGGAATLYTSRTKAVVAANPVTTAGVGSTIDANGNLSIFADPGPYDLVITVDGVVTTVRITVPIDPDEAAQDTDVSLHLSDASDAHDASAISFVPAGTIAASNVQAAIEEVASEAGGDVAAHLADGTDAHDASAVSFVAVGTIASTDVQSAVAEVATDAAASLSGHAAAGDPHPGYATDADVAASNAALAAHLADAVDAHDASATSFVPTGTLTSTDVQAALAELDGDVTTASGGLAAHLADATDAHDASAVSVVPGGGLAATDAQAALLELDSDLTAHITDATAAHAGSAVSFAPTGTVASTDVQSAVAEVSGDVTTVASDLASHLGDPTAAHAASAVSFIAGGSLASTDVQAALAEVATDYIAADAVIAGNLAAHLADTVDAHDASAISFLAVGTISSTDVQSALAEVSGDVTVVVGDLAAHLADATAAHAASAISFSPVGTIAATDVQAAIAEVASDYIAADVVVASNAASATATVASNLATHIANPTAAHAASAVSFSPVGTIAATNVQAAIAEVATDAAAAYLAGSFTSGSILFSAGGTAVAQDNANLVYDDTNDLVIIGPRGSYAPTTGKIHTVSTTANSVRGIVSLQATTDAIGARKILRKARGTPSALTTVVTADVLGEVIAEGYDGTNFLQMAAITFLSEGTIAATRVPTAIILKTATNAAPSVLTEAARIDSAQNISVGQTIATAGRFNVLSDATGVAAFYNAGSATGARVRFRNSRGTVASPTISVTGDEVGSIIFGPHDGVVWQQSATIRSDIEGTVGTGATPGRLVFSTTAVGAVSVTEAMRIDSAQNVGIGTTPTGSRLSIIGKANAYTLELTGSVTSGQSFGAAIYAGTTSADLALDVRNQAFTTRLFSIKGDGSHIIGNSATTLATGGLSVYGAASQKALVARANATTPGNIFEAQSSAGTVVLSISKDGLVTGNNSGYLSLNSVSAGIQFGGVVTSGDPGFAFSLLASVTHTSGTRTGLFWSASFAPPSGTGVYNHATIAPSINQTGGANGITRGLYVNPTVTAAADFRALEVVGSIYTSVSYFVAGTKVIGAQGAAVADVAAIGTYIGANTVDLAALITTLTDLRTQFNLLLARVRAATGHGLIA